VAARLYGFTVVRDFTRERKILFVGGQPRWRVMHEGESRRGHGRKNPRRGWKQHHAKFPQRGLAQTMLILHNLREANKKARREKAK
jgi:hypothetical protein